MPYRCYCSGLSSYSLSAGAARAVSGPLCNPKAGQRAAGLLPAVGGRRDGGENPRRSFGEGNRNRQPLKKSSQKGKRTSGGDQPRRSSSFPPACPYLEATQINHQPIVLANERLQDPVRGAEDERSDRAIGTDGVGA